MWGGAALFFVGVAIRPIRSEHFDSEQRARLAQMLFPGYYAFGIGLMGVALLAGLLAGRPRGSRDRLWRRLSLISLMGALIVTLIDWFWVYGPLAAMINAELTQHIALPSSFRNYHVASMLINTLSISLILLAAVLGCWPEAPVSIDSHANDRRAD